MQERSWSCRSRTWWFLCSPPQVYKVYNVLLDVTLFQRLSHFLIQLQCPHAWPETQRKQKPNNELKDAAQLLWHSYDISSWTIKKKKKQLLLPTLIWAWLLPRRWSHTAGRVGSSESIWSFSGSWCVQLIDFQKPVLENMLITWQELRSVYVKVEVLPHRPWCVPSANHL